MNDTIVINYSPFTIDSIVAICKDGKKEYTRVNSYVVETINSIIGLAYQHDIYNIKVCAAPDIVQEISEGISKRENDKYSQNKITVEGI